MHTSFKLSGSGEIIYLSNKDTIIIEEISYSEQTADLSTGRYPNGTGSFIQMKPTFGVENVDGITSIENQQLEMPRNYSLAQNYPNPFNPSTIINFSIPESGLVALKVFNILGQEVAELVNEVKSAGNYEVQFNTTSPQTIGRQLSSGIYIYRLQVGSFFDSKKMLLVK